jgi:hypothetical protein
MDLKRKYAEICTKNAKKCIICTHEIYMQYAKICTPHFADDWDQKQKYNWINKILNS